MHTKQQAPVVWLDTNKARELAELAFDAAVAVSQVIGDAKEERVGLSSLIQAFLASSQARILLGPVGSRVGATALHAAFVRWSEDQVVGPTSQAAFGRALAESPLVQGGKQPTGKYYTATPALHALWGGGHVPAPLGGKAATVMQVVGVDARPREKQMTIKAVRGGTPLTVHVMAHASVFDAHHATAWAGKRLGGKAQVRVYVTNFQLPEADRRALDEMGVASIMAPHLFSEVSLCPRG